MNAIAQLAHFQGARVTGSDRLWDQGVTTPVFTKLQQSGVTLVPQDGAALQAGTTGLVVSSAIEPDNVEVQAARARGIPVWHRAQWLADVVKGGQVIAIAGTAGKTTVTGLTGWALTVLGLNPNVVNGGALLNWRTADTIGNVRWTGSEWWVIEVDESDRSLLQFQPDWAVLTNCSHDHFSLDETIRLFRQFVGQVKQGVIGPRTVQAQLTAAGPSAHWISPEEECAFALSPGLPGVHNQANARLAAALCRTLGYGDDAIQDALAQCAGIERRLEYAGTLNGAPVYDDYAHNPAKIAAAWQAVCPRDGRLFASWRPHGFGPLSALAPALIEEWAQRCRPADHLYILPVYYSGGTPGAHEWTVDGLVAALRARGVTAMAVPDFTDLEQRLRAAVQPGDVVLSMGARDPELPVFARRLTGRALAKTPRSTRRPPLQ